MKIVNGARTEDVTIMSVNLGQLSWRDRLRLLFRKVSLLDIAVTLVRGQVVIRGSRLR